ncbi:nitrate- and nitrite sensing domain-containing protein [Paremcibacter congregatus]|uniref:nitrate- and nitrite sensing domain-containing protein n=1 Tax=Paremcibacter congregatus TaxID=2043170 RepID=UPI003A8E144A
MNKTLLYLGDALHQMQAERGCAVLFTSSKGTLFRDELETVFEQSAAAFNVVREKLKEWHNVDAFDDDFLNKIEVVLDNCETVKSRRNRILNLEFNPTEIISGYSHNVISPLIDLMVLVALFNKDNDPAKISAYSYFLQLKEKFGRERALGARGLVTKSFENREFLDRFRFLVSEQNSFKRTFFAMADDQQKHVYDSIMQGNAVQKLTELHDSFKPGHKTSAPALTPQDWFGMTSEKMNLMKTVEEELAETLEKDAGLSPDQSSLPRIQVTRQVDGITTEQRNFIEELPFFINLPEDILTGLLQHAQVREYKKGKLLFLEGEVSSRLHIMLSGWVKLFKGTAQGEETVMQMLSSGDMISESSVFLNANYPVSAQVAKQAVILTLPAPIIRERIKEHNELALRVVASMSKNSHTLIQEFENIRLKPATERVGWFLLKLLLEQGQVPDLIELPYDKSLIASYLDMKPETFSRTLKRFRDNGFEISKNSVILPNINALCGFCDHDLATGCDKHGTPACPNPDCDQDLNADF